MIYTHRNVLRGTTLTDLDTRQRFRNVVSINTETGEVVVTPEPVRIAADGATFLTETIRFAAIWPVMDRGFPCLFHCHGRLN
ncbi:hypothetical protein [Roseateles puraquae]|jgi:hypothetical protein|uniref:hypothetical protein n=1 Tax=Roseateles puraquae TaxID=431059 RepID=UPI0031D14EC3